LTRRRWLTQGRPLFEPGTSRPAGRSRRCAAGWRGRRSRLRPGAPGERCMPL